MSALTGATPSFSLALPTITGLPTSQQNATQTLGDFYNEHPELKTVFPAPTAQPDIEWVPSYEKFLARQKRRQAQEVLQDRVPPGWPERVDGPEVWDGNNFTVENGGTGEATWIVRLEPEHIKDIEKALEHFNGLHLAMGHVCVETFPLDDETAKFLRQCARRIYHGNGFLVLRGLDPSKYTAEDNTIFYAGIASYFGNRRGIQNRAEKEVLAHVVDTGVMWALYAVPTYTNDAQPFHSDLGDVVSLYSLQSSASGGASNVASTAQVYNELAKTRPDIIHTLSSVWAVDGFGGTPPYRLRPLLFHHGGHVILNFARRLLTGYGCYRRSQYLPAITEAQAEALDAIEFTARKFAVTMTLEAGDIQFLNNHATIHGRNGFRDGPEGNSANKQRHLLRLWTRDEENAWELPPGLQMEWASVFKEDFPAEEEVFPCAPTSTTITDTTTSCA
ncbi:Clavaminate synthase-like protein [Acephala macrosclerotiorum]|nr:Clavaminate synthase-like protein [Acephala macrosclerotiorum]